MRHITQGETRMKTGRLAVVAAASLALMLSRGARADDKPVTLVRAQKVGDVVHGKLTANLSIAGMMIKLEEDMKIEVKQIKPDGSVVTAETLEGGKISLPQQDIDIPAGPGDTVTRDKFGKLVDLKESGEDQSGMSPEVKKIMSIVQDIIFTDKPVMPNDSWETKFDNPAVKGQQFTIKSSYVGIEKVDGKDLWKLKQTTELQAAADSQDKMTYETTYFVDPTNGQTVKANVVAKNIPSGQGVINMDGQMTITKAPAAAKSEK